MKHDKEAPNKNRIQLGLCGTTPADGMNGFFAFERTQFGKGVVIMFVVVSTGENTGWEHVSVSIRNYDRLPTWDEMCYIKDKFWNKDEVVVQFHPKEADYIDNFPVLHLWRKVGEDYETPPTNLVGMKNVKYVHKKEVSDDKS